MSSIICLVWLVASNENRLCLDISITDVFFSLGVSKKSKVVSKGNKVKREDDEEDAMIMQEKMSALASLGGKWKTKYKFLKSCKIQNCLHTTLFCPNSCILEFAKILFLTKCNFYTSKKLVRAKIYPNKVCV